MGILTYLLTYMCFHIHYIVGVKCIYASRYVSGTRIDMNT